MEAQPKSRPISEFRRLVAADHARFYKLHELWQEMTEAQQNEIIATAREMVWTP